MSAPDLPAGVIATVVKYDRGWLLLDRKPALVAGDGVLLGYQERPICGAKVTRVQGQRIQTDFSLFFASPGDQLLEGADL